jgi:DNA gyrase/topoisomerase IV subunit B
MFSEHIEFQIFDKGFVGIFPNEHDEFNFFSYVNGLYLSRGGSHIDYIINNIVNPIREKLVKKFKNIKPADIKNKFSTVIFLRDFANPKFDSQTKETLTNAPSDISKYISDKIDFEKFAKQILKNENIINPIVETFKIKEELKARSELKQVKKTKIKSDKYFPGVGNKKYLFLVEGLSAAGGLMKCLGRDGKYYYALRGLALNAYDSTIQKIAANQEIKEVFNILNLDLSKHNTESLEIDFEKIVIACDADVDGINISSMLFGWWYKLCPELYNQHKIYRLNTPVVILKDNKDNVKKWFFTFNEFKQWEESNKDSKLKVIYLKGLGSLETKDLDYIISKDGFNSLLEEYVLDDESKEYFENWLGADAIPRKKYMKEFELDINRI